MSISQLSPQKSLNKAYRKVKPVRKDIDAFKVNLIALLDNVKPSESEEFHKNLIIDFLKKTYYDPDHYVNTRGREDLVIHNGKTSTTSTGVLIEAKSPTNTNEMPSDGKVNTKAVQELVLYYLRERITEGNDEVRHLIVTNVYEWYIFDAQIFDKCFAQDTKLVKKFKEFEAGKLSDTKTSHFYKEIAKVAIDKYESELTHTYFDLRKYEKPLRNEDLKDDRKLVTLYKIFSPQHLLKKAFANDSNSLDKKFYDELLHIIGLHEERVKGKKLIKRKPEGKRDNASILENTIAKLKTKNSLNRLPNRMQYGADVEEQLFNLGLELVITWINRILFLKLLEAQLVGYHRGDKSYRFLNLQMIDDYDQLFTLFHEVLAIEVADRQDDISDKYSKVPYLNSSLFEIQELEHDTVDISGLKNDLEIPIHTKTVLKDNSKTRRGKQSTLSYLFDFLDAYDFSSEGGEDIQEENKNLINASVLGLIFEKINGYKDGSFFTPGFITMYMCRETIRRAVVQKFVDAKGWKCKVFDDLYEDIQEYVQQHEDGRAEGRKEVNNIINSLKICDPAVGSGHFLVSALNEIMSIKSDLKILQDEKGKTLRDYELEVVNDELVISVEEELFEYHPDNKEASRVQKTLFHEKQTIIENCLFGVDINPNSVKICQLRLWVELLKHAYYNDDKQLETLPNIDINIKCGNSLISRFDLEADMSEVFTKKGYSQTEYLNAVSAYKDAPDKDAKAQLRDYLAKIKSEFHTNLYARDPRKKKLSSWRGQLNLLENKEQLGDLFEKISDKKVTTKIAKLQKDITKLELELQDEEDGRFYELNNAFEWRFEFPEVLEVDGSYRGFDVVIGNPPYGAEINERKYFKKVYLKTSHGQLDTYKFFIELGLKLSCNKSSIFSYITSDSYLEKQYFKDVRKLLGQKCNYIRNVKLGDDIFDEVNLPTSLFITSKSFTLKKDYEFLDVSSIPRSELHSSLYHASYITSTPNLEKGFVIIDSIVNIEDTKPLIELYNQVMGVKVYQIGKGTPKQTIKEKQDDLFISDEKLNPTYKKYISQGVERYNYKDKHEFITYGPWLAEPRKKEYFESPKIVVREIINPRIFACYFEVECVIKNIAAVIIARSTEYTLPYLLAILNSKLMTYYVYEQSPKSSNKSYPSFNSKLLKGIPIKMASLDFQGELGSLALKQNIAEGVDSNVDSQIDLMIYKLYGLTYDEVLIVEESVGDGSFGVSEAEYYSE